jgi:hypothetical protein
MSIDRDSNEFSGLYDVQDIANDPDKLRSFAISLWCAITGMSVDEAFAREQAAEERIARHGPPIEAPANAPWPHAIQCADCGKVAHPFQAFRAPLPDVPQHRWTWRYRCMHCYDEHTMRKWRAIGRGMRR